jgi:tetratricopeptide (TPR) repeat protein
MTSFSLWTRLKNSRLFQVFAIYLGASWLVLQVVELFIETMGLPRWTMPWTLALLIAGLVIVLATAWIQSHPLMPQREAADEVPRDWEVDLREIKESISAGRLPHLNWMRVMLVGAFAFSLLFGLAGLYVVIQDRGRRFSSPEALAEAEPAIAVLPFRVADPTLEIWREGMVDLLSTNLDGAGGMRAINSRTVLARWAERTDGEGTLADLDTALGVAAATGARYALIGSAISLGSELRLVAEIYEVDGGSRVGEARVEGSPDSVLDLVDRLSIDVLALLPEDDTAEIASVNLASMTTSSMSALKAFLDGETKLRSSNFDAAADAYQRAIQADTTFALAYYRLGWAYGWMGMIGSERTLESLRHALRLWERLPRREAQFAEAGLALGEGFLDGLPILREATRQYPDDAEAWYRLGDTYYHLDQALATLEDAEAAFQRAVDLEPRFAPYRIHLIDLAFENPPDSARASEELTAYRELSVPSDPHLRGRQVAFDLAFGNPNTRSQALETLDTLDQLAVFRVWDTLKHPRFWEGRKRALDEYEERLGITLYGVRLSGHLGRLGKLGEALEYAENPEAPGWYRSCTLYVAYLIGGSIDEEQLASALAITPTDSTFVDGLHCKGGYAAYRGIWADHAEAATLLRNDAQRNFAAGDSTAGRYSTGYALGLEGYARWKRGSPEAALPILEEAVKDTGSGTLRLWVGQLLLELGKPKDALRYFRSFRRQPWAGLFTGQAYEELKQWEEARQAYEEFAFYWADADPEFQPLVEEARQAIIRLKGLRRE